MRKWVSKNKNILLRLLGTSLSAFLLFLLVKEAEGEFLTAIQSANVAYLVAGLALMLPARLFVAARWYVLLRTGGAPISFRRVVALTFTGLFASNFLPTTIGGDIARLAGAIKLGYDRAICLAALIADRLVGMFGMFMVAPLGLALITSHVAQASGIALLWQRVWNFSQQTMQTISLWLRKPWALLVSLTMTWANMLFLFAAFYEFARGLGVLTPYWSIAGLYSLAYFVTLIPVSINGYGVQELSLTYLFSHFGGMTLPQSLTFAILVRLAFLLSSLPGAAFLPSILAESILENNKDII